MRLLAIILLGAAAGGVCLLGYPEPPVDPAWQLEASGEVPGGAVTVRFSDTTTLLFDDGETRWVVDGWFSRPSLPRMLFGEIQPDAGAIATGLAPATRRFCATASALNTS